MMSPGSRVMTALMYSMSSGICQIMSEVDASCQSTGRAGVRAAAGDVPAADRQLVRQGHLLLRDDDRAHRQEGVGAFRPQPLAVADLALAQGGLDALPVAGRDVVGDDVAGDVLVRVGRRDPPRPLADDHAELAPRGRGRGCPTGG